MLMRLWCYRHFNEINAGSTNLLFNFMLYQETMSPFLKTHKTKVKEKSKETNVNNKTLADKLSIKRHIHKVR